MLKQFMAIFSLGIFLCTFTVAQENPINEKEESQLNSEMNIEQQADTTTEAEELIIWNKVCPVKGSKVEEDSPTVEYNGKLYGFCCPGCDTKFAKNPEKYAKNLSEDGTKFIGKK